MNIESITIEVLTYTLIAFLFGFIMGAIFMVALSLKLEKRAEARNDFSQFGQDKEWK